MQAQIWEEMWAEEKARGLARAPSPAGSQPPPVHPHCIRSPVHARDAYASLGPCTHASRHTAAASVLSPLPGKCHPESRLDAAVPHCPSGTSACP